MYSIAVLDTKALYSLIFQPFTEDLICLCLQCRGTLTAVKGAWILFLNPFPRSFFTHMLSTKLPTTSSVTGYLSRKHSWIANPWQSVQHQQSEK